MSVNCCYCTSTANVEDAHLEVGQQEITPTRAEKGHGRLVIEISIELHD